MGKRFLRRLYTIPLKLRSLFRSDQLDRELDEELQYHLERAIEQNISKGMTPMQARTAALRAIGRLGHHVEECRDARGIHFIEDLQQDVRYACRTLARNKSFTAVAVLSLAIGIGANTAVFSVFDPLLLRRLPVPDPDRLVLVSTPPPNTPSYSISYPVFRRLQEQNQVFSSVTAALLLEGRQGVPARIQDGPEETVRYEVVAGDLFATLGVTAIAGRTFTVEDQRAGALPVAVIRYGFWMRRFGGDPGVIGKTIRFGNERAPATIIGVAARSFTGFDVAFVPDLWRPLIANPQNRLLNSPDANVFRMLGRLRPGAGIEQARAEIEGIFRQMLNERLEREGAGRPAEFRQSMLARKIDLQSGATGATSLRLNMTEPFMILAAAVSSVLLIACINIGALLLGRSLGRRRELSLRMAIGSGRFRLIRQLLTESLTLAAFGGIGSLAVAYWGAQWLLSYLPEAAASALNVGFDARVVAFAMAASFISAFLFGVVPAYRAIRRDLNPVLNEGPRSSNRSPHRTLHKALVVSQIAISMVLLVGSGLLVRTLHNFRILDAGFDRDNAVRFEVDRGQVRRSPEEWMQAFTQLVDRLEAYPGVRSATMMASLGFLRGARSSGSVQVAGRTAVPDQDSTSYQMFIGPGFFAASGISLLSGREIQAGDERPGPRVAIINQTMAKRFFANDNPIGKYFRFNDAEEIEVIGVAEDAKYDTLREEPQPTFYAPFTATFFATAPGPGVSFLVSGDSAVLTKVVTAAVSEFDRNFRAVNIQTLGEIAEETLGRERLLVQFASLFSMLALLLACTGLYGMLSYGVAQRRHEIGIRMALGARIRNVIGMIMRETGSTVGIGITLGLIGAFAVTRAIDSYLFGLTSTDPTTIGIATSFLIIAAAFAAFLPARRATRVDPLVALRQE
jgi:predicted permease